MRRAPRAGGAGVPRSPGRVARTAIAAALCAAAIAIAGCGSVAEPRDPAVYEGTGQGVKGRLTLTPEPALAMKPVRLTVALFEANGRPLTDGAVTFDLSMPAMTMPPNRPTVSPAGDGVYEATTMLTMTGEWRLVVEIDGPGKPVTVPFTFSAR